MARIGLEDGPVKVKMTKTRQASPNGFAVQAFYEGAEYTLSPSLAKALAGSYTVVVERDIQQAEVKREKKNVGAAPKNKASYPKENK